MTGIDETVAVRAEGAPSATSDAPIEGAVAPTERRPNKWDRPPPPHDWRFYVGNLGKLLIAVGLLLLAFVAYQLWGTGIETARAQRALESDFEELLAEAPDVGPAVQVGPGVVPADAGVIPADDAAEEDASTVGDDDDVAPVDDDEGAAPVDDAAEIDQAIAVLPAASQNIPEVESGDALARIEIPAIGVDDIVVAGVSTGDLKRGPGHFPDTPLPGQLGNAAIAGPRSTYGAPFKDVDDLVPGDEIVVTTLNGTYVYRVTGQQIVPPSAYEVVSTTDPTTATLTLTSCHPEWTARDRIVISSELDAAASATVGAPVLNYGQTVDDTTDADLSVAEDDTSVAEEPIAEPAPTDDVIPGEVFTPATGAPASAAANVGIADAFAEGWFSDSAAFPHVAFWGVLLALIGLGAYLLSRRVRHDSIGLLVGIVPFVVALYFFFQNVNRLLPPNL